MPSQSKRMEQAWQRVGEPLWGITYRVRPNDDDYAIERIRANLDPGVVRELYPFADRTFAMSMATYDGLWCAKWVDGAMRTLETSESYAAAMSCTVISRDDRADISLPWPAFLVRLPVGLYLSGSQRDGQTSITHVRCMQVGGTGRRGVVDFLTLHNMRPVMSDAAQDTLIDALFDEGDYELPDVEEGVDTYSCGGVSTRSSRLIKRAIVGLLYTVQHTSHWRERAGSVPTHRRYGGRARDPQHRHMVVGRAIATSFSSEVRNACASKENAVPYFQTLVRGHRKRQVIGIGCSGRKVIWVEPYWRGPEDAPILARPYRVGA